MNYSDYFGYAPLAPQYAYSNGAAPDNTGMVVPAPLAAGGPASLSASGSFAVAGWLAGLIFALAAYRILWERAG